VEKHPTVLIKTKEKNETKNTIYVSRPT